MLKLDFPLVSVDWLSEHFDEENLVILDASIKKVSGGESEVSANVCIPNARFFDISHRFSLRGAPFPNTIPTAVQFQNEARSLGINNNSAIVIYDDNGMYSSPRAWYLFRVFGHDNVAVLDGGLPAWQKADMKVVPLEMKNYNKGDLTATYHADMMRFYEEMKDDVANQRSTVLDARSEGRFKGIEPEPRDGLRSGTIPNSQNLPYESLFERGLFKSEAELRRIFNIFANQDEPMIFTCGSGITACVLALGATIGGYKNVSVYDGSWTEWGSLTSD